MNHGLILISPIILVRLLSVEEFGRYREFLVYASVLASIAGFGINSSLLRFVPDSSLATSRVVSQTILMTFASSVLVVGSMLALNALFEGKLVGDYAVTVAIYVFLFVNLDFWEFLWLAEKRSFAVLGYSTTRIVARIVVVTVSAAVTEDVGAIIYSLIGLESVRLFISAIGWRVRARSFRRRGRSMWREQLQYCLPFGAALTLSTVNKSMGSVLVAKMLGPVALAHYAIGVYVEPIITVLRNSLSEVLLPEMVSRNRQTNRLLLWHRTTIVTAVFLIATGVVLGRFAETLVVTLFSEKYLPAVAVLQIYLFVFLRESMDFSTPLRAINRTAPILRSNLLAMSINAVLLLVLLPSWGLIGAVVAFVVSRFFEGAYLGWQTMRAYEVSLRQLAPWKELAKVVLAAGLAAVVLFGEFWTERLGLAGLVLGAAAYVATFIVLLVFLRVREVPALLRQVCAMPPSIERRPR
jgi:O-antigen/teichoic acid export membrane protein